MIIMKALIINASILIFVSAYNDLSVGEIKELEVGLYLYSIMI